MQVWRCDRCGKILAQEKEVYQLSCRGLDEEFDPRTGVRENRRKYELCASCANDIERNITHGTETTDKGDNI